MKYLDARRLTGPNLLWSRPGAILDIDCTPGDADRVIAYCEQQILQMLAAVGWESEAVTHKKLLGGVSIAFSAPIDALYAASAIMEWAWACCDAEFNAAEAVDFEAAGC